MNHAVTIPPDLVTATIAEIRQVTPRIKSVRLAVDEGFRYRPGQWIDVAVDSDGETVLAGYSIVSTPTTRGFIELAVKATREHPVTRYLHERARVGDTVRISPAGQGDFWFEAGMADKVVLLGAGIGVTPLIGILRSIHEQMPDVQATLIYSVTESSEILFRDELECMGLAPNIRCVITVTRDAEDWRGHTGRISHDLLRSMSLPPDALYYYCGSRDFIEDMTVMLEELGIADDRLVFEKWW
ncbi:oxidoreductase [Thioalkalivibrio denitrificans]|uniref:Oxidoreductase n=1 Tax=Thioalkalivibrio denitrificans TaxID=108003 RepID=A0A1V3NGQ6_9GAMM|nr:FAD-dependent oxidoreductase [Thioalkalivibrio denitrificans]OOG24058.1 oxidoreductase [Thioalkalivibrio denitrificans]